MGFLDSIMGATEQQSLEKPSNSSSPFKISVNFSPVRLGAMKDNKVNAIIRITNVSGGPQLVSVDAVLPRGHLIGFDATCIHKSIEKKLGQVATNDSIETVIPIWANNQTKSGSCSFEVTVYSHYMDYNKVLSSVKKSATLRVV